MKIEATTAEMLAVCRTHIAIMQTTCLQWAYCNKSCQCSTEDDEEGIITQCNPCGNCTKRHTARERTLPSKGLYLPLLPEDWSLEAEVQEV